ncbi:MULTISPECIES: MDR family MFS transporter [unclassified Streptomyces]|uniref:MDR family MFS transporter n=1 Tax=unclassified Streptomyces TaxID=2593676 RepID=UPI00278C8CE4|nr:MULTISPECIES: MDR family MFS transporter [unclassified Streptomyces]
MQGTTDRRRGAVVAALMLSMALAALDSTIVSTAVPQIVGDLGGFSVFSWLFSGYLLAVTVTLPVYGKLSDTLGRKPVLIAGSVLFLAGSLLCASAWNMAALIAFRVVQGLGGGAIQGTVQTLAADLYPLEERPKIQAKLSTVWATSSVLGPALGGVLASYAGWRWIFLINLPIGAVALYLLVRHLHEPRRQRTARPKIDWAGALAVFAAGGALLTWLVQGGVAWAWGSAPSIALLCTGVGLIGAVFVIERRAAEPILPGWVWRRRTIAAVNLALGAMGLLMVAPTAFLPTYAQSVLGLSPTAAGFVLSVMTLSWPVSAALSQHVYRRIGFRDTAALGMTAAFVLLAAFPLLLPFPGEVWQPTLLSLLLGAALGLFQLPLIVGVQSTVGWAERGTATASVLFYRQIGQTVGAALFGAVANGVISARLGSGADLDSVARDSGADGVRRAIDAAVDSVYVGAACAAGVALLVLLTLAPRRFPVLESEPPGPIADEGGQEKSSAVQLPDQQHSPPVQEKSPHAD